jgi:hypothetical protein
MLKSLGTTTVEDGGNTIFRNIDNELLVYTASHPIRTVI